MENKRIYYKMIAKFSKKYYLKKLDMDLSKEETELTPLVRSFKGSLRGTDVSVRDYKHYIEDKYL